jgi:hypothetical protein
VSTDGASGAPHWLQNRPLAAAPQLGQDTASELPQEEQKRASLAF